MNNQPNLKPGIAVLKDLIEDTRNKYYTMEEEIKKAREEAELASSKAQEAQFYYMALIDHQTAVNQAYKALTGQDIEP